MIDSMSYVIIEIDALVEPINWANSEFNQLIARRTKWDRTAHKVKSSTICILMIECNWFHKTRWHGPKSHWTASKIYHQFNWTKMSLEFLLLITKLCKRTSLW